MYAVKVNVLEAPADAAQIPEAVDGVPVVLRVTGEIRKQEPEGEDD